MSRAIDHHLDPATLMAFSAGTLGEALSAVASAHLEMCEHCRTELVDLDMLGSVLLEGLKGDAVGARPRLPADVVPISGRERRNNAASTLLSDGRPESFARKMGVDLAHVPWRWVAPGVWHHRLKLSPGSQGDLRFLKIAAGIRMPDHGHGGSELTLVIDGAYRDERGEYFAGDIQDVDDEIEHRPVADPKTGCICIIASERPARYKSFVNRLLQPLTGI